MAMLWCRGGCALALALAGRRQHGGWARTCTHACSSSPTLNRRARPLASAAPPTPSPALPPLLLPCRSEVWRNLYVPGTFRGVLRACWRSLTTGQRFAWPQLGGAAGAAPLAASAAAADLDGQHAWYVGAADLQQFQAAVEAGDWGEPMMEKQWPVSPFSRRVL